MRQVWQPRSSRSSKRTRLPWPLPALHPATPRVVVGAVGDAPLPSPPPPTTTLGVAGCRAGRGHGSLVRFEERDERGCQTWRIEPVAGTATYTVTSPDSGDLLASGACLHRGRADGLRLVDARHSDATCTAWTLVPANDGTWTLTSANLTSTGTTQGVRLLIP